MVAEDLPFRASVFSEKFLKEKRPSFAGQAVG
jgi:hypothetical protein